MFMFEWQAELPGLLTTENIGVTVSVMKYYKQDCYQVSVFHNNHIHVTQEYHIHLVISGISALTQCVYVWQIPALSHTVYSRHVTLPSDGLYDGLLETSQDNSVLVYCDNGNWRHIWESSLPSIKPAHNTVLCLLSTFRLNKSVIN